MIKHCPSVTSELNRDPHEAKDSLGNLKDVHCIHSGTVLGQCLVAGWILIDTESNEGRRGEDGRKDKGRNQSQITVSSLRGEGVAMQVRQVLDLGPMK